MVKVESNGMIAAAAGGGCMLLTLICLYIFWPADFEVAIQRQQINATRISFAPTDCSVRPPARVRPPTPANSASTYHQQLPRILC